MKNYTITYCLLLIFIITSDAQVTQQWVKIYDGPTTGVDIARSIAVDRFGNVIVSGESHNGSLSFDYATIKYNLTGTQQWVSRYNSGDNGPDYSRSMGIDYAGNVYVTGDIYLLSTQADYATIKYNQSGSQQWLRTYNSVDSSADRAYSIAVDSSGISFITGSSYGSSHGNDIVTIKYSSGGSQLWVQRFNGPSNNSDAGVQVVIDKSLNAYVAGNVYNPAGSLMDYAVIKYNTSGVQQWVQMYNGAGNGNDEAASIALDDSGNVYITGYTTSSGSNHDFLTIKYNPAGIFQWARTYNGPPNGLDEATCIKADHFGNIFVGGSSTGSGNLDFEVIKYNSAGVQQWVRRYNSGYTDELNAIALDKFGNVYVTGNSGSASSSTDAVVIRYDSDSTLKWLQRYNGTSNYFDWGLAIAVDTSFNVYVAGQTWVTAQNDNFLTIKYSQPVGIKPISSEIPEEFSLSQNFPNPFNPITKLRFALPPSPSGDLKAGGLVVRLFIYNILGREVAALVSEQLNPGTYEVDWDGTNYSSGIYYYKLTAGDIVQTKKMVLLK